jgi:glycosyltransferase involved in cell wall biosynthesis
MIDSLALGGAERIAVDLANSLPKDEFEVHLCATRKGGPLEADIAPHVQFFVLGRKSRVDLKALSKLSRYLRCHKVRIIHAHSTSLFTAVLASFLPPFPKVVWHDHFGSCDIETRSTLVYGLLVRRASGVIAVNDRLANWAREALHVRKDRVWYIPNFVRPVGCQMRAVYDDLPGCPGRRVVCVAGIRPQKDFATLLRAFAEVLREVPDAVLIVVGGVRDDGYFRGLQLLQKELGLAEAVHWLGERPDALEIAAACDVGVLSSASEGLPVVLLEYGALGLPVVCTDVGQCREVVDGGSAGVLVAPGDHKALAEGIVKLLSDKALREELGKRLSKRVADQYSGDHAVREVAGVYREVLG